MVMARDIIERNAPLLSLPAIAVRLNEMVDDPYCTAADIDALFERDPELTARLLKIVNSPFYGFPSRINSVARAITILGARQLRDLVLAIAVIMRFGKRLPMPLDVDDFWRHSLCCATVARALANRMRLGNRERYFVAGLLHDIGRLALYLMMPEQARQLIQRAAKPDGIPGDLERSIFGVDHMEVGAALLRAWRLPESLVEPAAFHHAPRRAEHYPRETAVVHIANVVANSLRPGLPGDNDEHCDPHALRLLGLEDDILDMVLKEVDTRLEDTVQVLYTGEAA